MVVDLARIVGAPHVSNRDADRLAYGRDAWARDLMRLRTGEVPAAPECVVWPGSAEEVAEVLAFAERNAVAAVPYGSGGSSVGGARPTEGGIVIDLKRMKAIRSFDEINLQAEVEAGIIGERLERQLNARGYTLGHFPPSIGSATLGGWLATRSAGQMSTRYGKIEDMTLGLEVATPGQVRRAGDRPRSANGPDFHALFMGAEGTLGAITAARLRVRPLAATQSFVGMRFGALSAGVETLRRIMQARLRPAVLRLYDGLDTLVGLVPGTADARDEGRALDPLTDRAQSLVDDLTRRLPGWAASGRLAQRVRRSFMHGTVRAVIGAPLVLNRALDALPDDCLLIMGFEGQPALVAAELSEAKAIALEQGAVDLGPEPGQQWYDNRFRAPFRQSKVYAAGLFMDTFEATATWDRLIPMYRAVKRAITADAVVMAHFAHAYSTGCAVSFTFAGTGSDRKDARAGLGRYDRIVYNALRAVHESGGSVGHHHGIGTARAPAMAREHGPGGVRMLGALKRALDPAGVMNPGKLGLSAVPSGRTRSPAAGGEEGFASAVVAAVGERNVARTETRTTVRPPDESALAAVLRVAHSREVPVFTDQTGFKPPAKAVQLDLRKLDGVSRLSEHAQFVEAESGVVVHRLEALLQQHGLTLGPLHPRSLLRTVGAALARNLLIRRSVADGELGGLCMRVRGLLANGTVVETRLSPRASAGPDVARMLAGGQGRLGVLTKAVLRVQTIPRHAADVCYRVADLDGALAVARRAVQREVRPAAARLVPDATGVRVALHLVAPSDAHLRAQRTILATAARESGAVDAGEVAGLAEGGVFDAVVEAPIPWDRATIAVDAARRSGCAEVWLDFLTAEGLTLVARVPDRDVRRATVTALAELEVPIAAGDLSPGASAFEDALVATAQLLDPSGVFRMRSQA